MQRPATAGARFERCETRARQGDLLSRDVLDATERFAVVLAALAALSLDDESLAGQLGSLVEEGMDPQFAEDVLVQMAAYLGYPRAGRVLAACRRVDRRSQPDREIPERSDDERYELGISDYARLNPGALATITTAFSGIAGDLIPLTFRSFGDVFATSRQALGIRQLATVAALAALGGAAPQLRFHMGAALRVGVSREQLVEAIAWVQFLAGMPAAYNALVELKQAVAEGPEAPPAYS